MARGRDQMREPERLRPKAPHHGALDESRCIRPRTSDRGREDRSPFGRDREQSVRPQEAPALLRTPGKPLPERRSDSAELGRPPRYGDDRHAQRPVDRVEVEDVEPANHGTVDQKRPNSVEGSETPDECDHSPGPVGSVDADPAGAHGLEVVRHHHGHRRQGGVPVRAVERPVVDSHHSRVDFVERAPQR